jgi:cytoskeletal protein CcmA (bactofilin family)
MAQNYTRQSSMADGDTITAALFNNEYNQLVNAFAYSSSSASSTGHRHDGSSGQGGNIPQIGDLDFLNKVVVDGTNNRVGFFVEVSSSAVEQVRIQDGAIVPVTDNDIDLGTSSLEFKDGYFDGTVYADAINFNGTAITSTAAELNILDGVTSTAAEINLLDGVTATTTELNYNDTGASVGTVVASKVVTVDANKDVASFRNITLTGELDAGSLDISGDADIDGTLETDALSINGTAVTSTAAELNILDGATVVVGEINALDLGSTAVGTAIASKAVILDSSKDYTGIRNLTITGELDAATLDISGDVDVDGTLETDALSINGTAVTSTAVELNILDGVTSTAAELNILDGKAFLDEDNMASNSATGIASQQSIKAYVDSQVTAQDLDFQADSGGALSIDLDSETLTFTGGTGIDTSGSGNAVTFAIDSTVTTLTGSQTLTNKTLTAPTLTGTAVVASLDISGDIDVDGTTNLDVVDVDGAVDMASTLAVAGVVTANAGVVVDNITIDGNEIDVTSGNLTLDIAADLIVDAESDIFLDAASGIYSFNQAGSTGFTFTNSSGDITLKTATSDKDLIVQGVDGGATITALTLDMSAAGAATFNSTVTATGLDISGDIDVDGTTNLDVVDIDGAVDMASTLTVGGNVTINSTTLKLSGDFPQLFFEDTAGSDVDAYIVNNANGLFIGKTNSPSASNDILSIDLSTGNVGINGSSAGATLQVNQSSLAYIDIRSDDSLRMRLLADSSQAVLASEGVPLIFKFGSAEAMRIDSNGRLLFAQTSGVGIGGTPADVNGTEIGKGYINLNRDDTASANQIQFGKNGSVAGRITTTTTTSYVETSDRRVKSNIADAEDCGTAIDLMQVRKFDWTESGEHHPFGMIAQELLEIAPIAVDAPDDPSEMMGIDYSKLVPMLVKEIQSLRARVQQLENN